MESFIAGEITVVTPTCGASRTRLAVLCRELRAFTRLDFRHIVCDDGTISETEKDLSHQVCNLYGAYFYENPGPTFGVSFNLNHAFSLVKTRWAFLIEDGLRPSQGWLETALDCINKIGEKTWEGHRVGMIGFASIQDWVLSLGGAWPGKDVMEVFKGDRSRFYDDWNDGYWCWRRMLPAMKKAIEGDTSHWTNDVLQWKQIATGCMPPDMHPVEREQCWQKWRTGDHWPGRRTAWTGWYPGAFMLINMDAWRKVGKWRDGATFFEGHLGIRMGLNGYLSLCCEGPPFLHCPSQGFSSADLCKTPRFHRDTAEIFLQDFGKDNMDAPMLCDEVVTKDVQKRINEQLAGIELEMVPGWEKWV